MTFQNVAGDRYSIISNRDVSGYMDVLLGS